MIRVSGLIQILIGVLLVVFALYLLTYSSWLGALIRLLQGAFIILLGLVALVLIILGAISLKE